MLRRTTILAITLALAAFGPVAVFAAPPSPSPAASSSAAAAHHDAGRVSGTITGVDYQNAIISLSAAGRGKIDIAVLPSTQIQGKDSGYHAISDLKPGTRVDVDMSESGGHYTAQIIKIK